MMEAPRNYVKNSPSDSKNRWRNRFRKEYANKFKEARNSLVNKNRENQWMQKVLAEDWERFVRENQEAMRQEGLLDIDNLIQDSYELADDLDERAAEELQEQEELVNEIESYEASKQSIICVNCCKTNLVPSSKHNTSIALCHNCGFYATENCLYQILQAVNDHSNNCTGTIGFSLEPGTDNTIVGNCETCDLWDMFYM